jgi:neutral ceramidase
MTTRTTLRCLAAVGFLATVVTCPAQMGNLRAGAAKVDISPTKDMFPMGNYISLHDPLFARALVIDNGSTKAAFISVDATSVPGGDQLVKNVSEELKIPAERVIVNATHDHSAPMGGGGPRPGGAAGAAPGAAPPATAASGYSALLQQGIVEAARQANANLQPARVGFGTGKAYVNTNRDEFMGQGYHMGYSPDGPSDKTVTVVAFTRPTGEPIAVYSNYAVHCVVMYLTKTQDGKGQVTSDLGGWTAKYVEDHFPGAVSLWTPGAAGDQNPLFQGDYNQDAPDVHEMGELAWGLLDVQSRRLGEEIVRVTRAIQNTSDRALIWGVKSSVNCPGQKRAQPAPAGVPAQGWQAPPPSTVKMIDGDPVTIPLSLLMINDIAITGVGGEVFTEIGMHVKKDSLFDRTMMVTLLPGGAGYIPTDKAFLLPSEKAVGNRLKPGCAEPAMVGEFQNMMKSYLPIWKAAK